MGSSPRMRGTQNGESTKRLGHGIIPAYAGNTFSAHSSMNGGDHPRVCGEHKALRATAGRMQWIIPAYAGNTGRFIPLGFTLWDHPRVCGEHQQLVKAVRDEVGIIPAYAGNTSAACRFSTYRWDHPRVCGEHSAPRSIISSTAGSSPRMRGTRHVQGRDHRRRGIIPAYAGNTCAEVQCPVCERDHPRVCGEHPVVPEPHSSTMGSSPRMRGTLRSASARSSGMGIIPAYAGNTSSCISCCSRCGDHPRVCGEHAPYAPSISQYRGSSPRMRGTPWTLLQLRR